MAVAGTEWPLQLVDLLSLGQRVSAQRSSATGQTAKGKDNGTLFLAQQGHVRSAENGPSDAAADCRPMLAW